MSVTATRLLEEDAEFAVRIASDIAGRQISVEHEKNFLSNRSNVLIAGTVGDEPAGFISAHILDRFKDYRRKVFIYEVDVLPQYQRRGVGRVMIMRLIEVAQSGGADTAFVFTNRSNSAAIGLYSSCGGHDPNPDDVMMEFSL